MKLGIRDFPHLKLAIRDFKAKSERDSVLKVCAEGGMPKITLGITELHEILGRDYGIEEPFKGLCENAPKIGSTLEPVPRQKPKISL